MKIKDDNKTIECNSLEWSKAMYIVTLELMVKEAKDVVS